MHRKFYLSLSLISGLLFFVFMLFAGYKEVSPEWKKYQAEYKELFIKNAKDEATKERARSFDAELQQIYLSSLKRVDRCTSCHIGVENPVMANAQHPYKQHSGNYLKDHLVERYGCTVCHNGQGRALNTKEAHGTGRDTHWDYPLLPLKYIQSSCAQCHDFKWLRDNGGEIAHKGEKLFRENGCKGCHKLNDVGGSLGKALDGIGSQPIAYFPMKYVKGEQTVHSWLKEHFDDPRDIVPESQMKIYLKDNESDLLTTYMLTLRSEEIPKKYRSIWRTRGRREAMDGESLYKMYCIACHTTGKHSIYAEVFGRTIPAILNPALTKAADDRTLKMIIGEGRTHTQMMSWKADAAGLTEEEIDKIVKYIARQRPKERPEPFLFSNYKVDVKHGEELFKIRCATCHGADGEGGEDLLGINLKNPVAQEIDPEFFAVTVRDGRQGTPMVAIGKDGIGLKDQDIADLIAYILTSPSKK